MTCPICYSMYVENVWPWLVLFSVLLLVWVHWRRRPCWFGPEIAFWPTLPNCRELSLKLRFFHFSSCHISCRAISTPTSSRGKVVTGLLLLKYSPGLQAPAQKRTAKVNPGSVTWELDFTLLCLSVGEVQLRNEEFSFQFEDWNWWSKTQPQSKSNSKALWRLCRNKECAFGGKWGNWGKGQARKWKQYKWSLAQLAAMNIALFEIQIHKYKEF